MRLPSFRVRTIMMAVAIAALLLWGGMMGVRSYDYYRRANAYSFEERSWKERTARGDWRRETGSECADYFAQLAEKYRRAMWHPWESVAPDPHAPGFDLWQEQERRKKEFLTDPLTPGNSGVPE